MNFQTKFIRGDKNVQHSQSQMGYNPNHLFSTLQKTSVTESCQEISNYLKEERHHKTRFEFRDFSSFFPILMNQIFGVGDSDSEEISYNSHYTLWVEDSSASKALYNLLSPSGPLLKVILQWSSNNSLLYPFPIDRLPARARKNFLLREINGLSPFMARKFSESQHVNQMNRPMHIYLNIFEYFFFCFACYVVKNERDIYRHSAVKFYYKKPNEPQKIYYDLLAEYLDQFILPLKSDFSIPEISLGVLEIFCECWFRQNDEIITSKGSYIVPTLGSLKGSLQLLNRIISVYILHYQSINHSHNNNHYFDYIKKPLFHFLQQAFTFWPLESATPFNIVVDIWLNFIEPWKNNTITAHTSFDPYWHSFVESNFLYYTNLFSSFLDISLEFNYSTQGDIKILQKVLETFSKKELSTFIFELEDLIRPHYATPDAYNYWSPTRKMDLSSVIWNNCLEIAGRNLRYKSLQSIKNTTVTKLVHYLLLSKINEREMKKSPQKKSTGLALQVSELIGTNQDTGPEPRFEEELEQLIHLLCSIFGITRPPEDFVLHQESGTPSKAQRSETGLLTPIGRKQIKNGIIQCNNQEIGFLGKEEFRPITTWENPTLVRLFYHLSQYLNQNHQNHLNQIGITTPVSLRPLANYKVYFWFFIVLCWIYLIVFFITILVTVDWESVLSSEEQ